MSGGWRSCQGAFCWFSVCVLMALALVACRREEAIVLEPLPAIAWEDVALSPFASKEAWSGQRMDWAIVTAALRSEIEVPEALETKLHRDERRLWKEAIASLEQYQLLRRNALVLSNLQVDPSEVCVPPSSIFSLHQRSQIQLMLQQHRNVLWRLGRLDMATRYVENSFSQFIPLFKDRIKHADVRVVEPVVAFMRQVHAHQALFPKPNGAWKPGELHFRMGRLAQMAPLFLQAQTNLRDWNHAMASNERWQYLASTGEVPLKALDTWIQEYGRVIQAFHGLTASVQAVEQSFASPNHVVGFACINKNLRRLRVLAGLYDALLPMQWALNQTDNAANVIKFRLGLEAYSAMNHEYLASEIERFQVGLRVQEARLARAQDLVLVLWDETSYLVWTGMPEFIDSIRHHSKPAVENAEVWNVLYHNIVSELQLPGSVLKPEPPQPNDRRGRPYPAYIATILETLRSPARIDEVERGLLAISELEAHLVGIRDELLRLCKDGACRSFPEAELANSPRTSPWVVLWRQSPIQERTLGHSLIVLKLCQLHLSRLVQRLSEIYAWFAETSNADITWKKLDAWQRIWTLYAEPNGTYASFLRSVSALDSTLDEIAKPHARRAESEVLLAILQNQAALFNLTIDYARFIDRHAAPPVSFEHIIQTWEHIDELLSTIERLTLERDAKENPDSNARKPQPR